MNDRNRLRSELAADPDLGIGNALAKVVAKDVGLDEPTITFDTDIDVHHPAWNPLTLREINRLVAARASWLYGAGVRPRELVGIYAGGGHEQVLNTLALFRIGAIPALVNSNVSGGAAAAYFTKARPAGIITDDIRRAKLGELTAVALHIDATETGGGDPDLAPAQYVYHPEDAAVVTHSSGTTGAPKAVVASHAGLFASVRHRLTLPRAQGVDRMLSALPVNHAAMIILLNLVITNNSQLLILSDQSARPVLEAIQRWRPTAVLGFAATWPGLAAADPAEHDLESVRMWWNTGDCAHEPHIRKLVSRGSHQVATAHGARSVAGSMFIDGFGSTEMGHSQFFITHTPSTNRYGRCIGRKHTFNDVAVLDEAGEQVADGVVGQLAIRSPTLSIGYWNDHVTTAKTRIRGYFLTGDLVYRDEAGYFYHVDRATDSLQLQDGSWLYTAQCEESVLAVCPDILDCTVVGVRRPDGRVATRVMLVLAGNSDQERDRTPDVLRALPSAVAATVTDVLVAGDDEIPHGPTGKVRKNVLREQAVAGISEEGLVVR